MLEVSIISAGYSLNKSDPGKGEISSILNNINLTVKPGEILALVGESGSGKSTLGLAIVGLVPHLHGTMKFNGEAFSPFDMGDIRSKIQFIFQDPYSSLNPRMTIGQCIREVLVKSLHGQVLESEIVEVLSQVELGVDVMAKYPHELSGGQCQRANIGRALAMNPDILICDEIVSALDVSVQAKILNVLENLKKIRNLGILFTTHDLHVVKSFADEMIILHQGKIVERGYPEKIFAAQEHSYTAKLLQSAYGLAES